MSLVRENLLTRLGYRPYCGNTACGVMPRAGFNGQQFECSYCRWQSNFEPEFIEQYKNAQEQLSQQAKAGI